MKKINFNTLQGYFRIRITKEMVKFWCFIIFVILPLDIFISDTVTYFLDADTTNTNVECLKRDMLKLFKVSVIRVPILESIVFFYIPFYIIFGIKKMFERITHLQVHDNIWQLFFILLTSVLFAFDHRYSVAYIIFAFVSGLLMSILYVYAYHKKYYPLMSIILLHMLNNLVAFIVVHTLGIKSFWELIL